MPATTDLRPPLPPPRTQAAGYLPGLDGLRALAVAAVVLYHADVGWMRGGFLGVDIFFVISGYLITLLLLSEQRWAGRISLRQFWTRRARRLLPALYALLLAVTAVSVVWLRDDLGKLRGQLLAALTYSTNWYLIATDNSYFAHLGRPPLLEHLWSLAVEEQFYLLWPVVLVVLLALCRRRLDVLVSVVAAGILASTAWMAVLYDRTDPSRAYYGTDTRAAALLLGALLAMVWRPDHLRRGGVAERGRTVDMAGAGGLALLAVLCVTASATGPFLYFGGFLVVGLASVAAIAAVAHPETRLAGVLGVAPLRWLGQRSYAIYLWHWPVFCLTRPGVDVGWSPNQALLWRVAITLVLAELSYRFVEQPLRTGALRRRLARLRALPAEDRRHRIRVMAGAAAIGALLLGIMGASVADAGHHDDIVDSIQAGQQALSTQTSLAIPGDPVATAAPVTTTVVPGATATPPAPAPTRASASGTTAASASAATPEPTSTATTAVPPASSPPPATEAATAPPTSSAPLAAAAAEPTTTAAPPPTTAAPIHSIAVGDSVMLGAASALKQVLGADSYVDAKVGRQFTEGVDIVDWLRAQHRLGPLVIVHLGNNGTVSASTVDQMMQALSDVPTVLLVNVRVTRGWEGSVNATLAGQAAKFPNVRLVDWYDASAGHGDDFYSDGTHLNASGQKLYASVIQSALG